MTRQSRRSGHLPAKRIAVIHVARKQLGLDDESYRDILHQYGGARSAAELDILGFENVMSRFERLGFRSTWTKRTFGNRAGMASPAQIEYMRHLWCRYDPDDVNDAHLNAWLFKYHHVSALRFISAEKAEKVIPALKAMAGRKQDQI
ncbi:regulatory protein GemA [Mesorhizobium xinjiangense]|uniref:regulatory protein GemA n=1 Tax=Mesorhizobium xinjiangense TaxID=2678685 RepID=UPI0012ECEF56|nr:regulatory protein GemA [Mesorhizobium xinjiangense]